MIPPLKSVVTNPLESECCIRISSDGPRVAERRHSSDDQLQSPAHAIDGDKTQNIAEFFWISDYSKYR